MPLAQRLKVVASVFPLAEVARRVGLGRVTVTDLVPPGGDPRAAAPSGDVFDGAVVLTAGRGYQPAVDAAAAAGNGSAKPLVVVAVWDKVGGDQSNIWLDPTTMMRITTLVADVLSATDPAGRAAYQSGARAYGAQLGALDIDYRRSLADCARRDVVAADGAFTPLASRYGFVDHAVGESGILRLVQSRGVPTIFTEPLIPPGPAVALAQAARVKVDTLSTLETRSLEEAARGATYLSIMTDNLDKLRRALACTSGAGA